MKEKEILSCFNLVITTEEVLCDGEMHVSKWRQRDGTGCFTSQDAEGGRLLCSLTGSSYKTRAESVHVLAGRGGGGGACIIYMVICL